MGLTRLNWMLALCALAVAGCTASSDELDADGDRYLTADDCDDNNAAVYPGGTEVCDGLDNDCDGTADNGATDALSWYADSDGDGYGAGSITAACSQPTGFVSSSDDCDDDNANANPAGVEACDGMVDEDCDGQIDEAGATGELTWYLDGDSDQYGDSSLSLSACTAPDGYVAIDADCDDSNAAYHPSAEESCSSPEDFNCDGSSAYADADEDGYAACNDCDDSVASTHPDAVELCDGVDNNCDGDIDELSAQGTVTWYIDADGDGYGSSSSTTEGCYQPDGYVLIAGDCNDADAAISPTAAELCDASNTDEDCDGVAEESGATGESTWYRDADGDTYGDSTKSTSACDQPTGYVSRGDDCNDASAQYYPGATESCDSSADLNCDGSTGYVDKDGDGYAACLDCDDSRADVNPSKAEICDAANTDEDCDGAADDADDAVASGSLSIFYRDADRDGYGSASSIILACDASDGVVADATDCNDSSSGINPGATEVCDAADTDEDCDGQGDEAGASKETTWYADKDGDTWGDSNSAKVQCNQPSGYVSRALDCNDNNAALNPDAVEVCDASNTDEDCDGLADDADGGVSTSNMATYYFDADADGYGLSTNTRSACDLPSGYATVGGDCNDTSASINPGKTEICDAANTDEDCDGVADDNDPTVSTSGKSIYYTDTDGDGYGLTSSTKASCDLLVGYSAVGGDCNDANAAINPSMTEICDGSNTDEDCDNLSDDADGSVDAGSTLDWYRDADGDGYGDASKSVSACDQPDGYVSSSTDCNDSASSSHPGGIEVCDSSNLDEDCNGSSDDNDANTSSASKTTWYKDGDSDTYGTSSTSKIQCEQPSGYVTSYSDCNDSNAAINPAATEVCDSANTDEDCDGVSDDSDSSVSSGTKSTWYKDSDSDGYGLSSSTKSACDLPSGYSATSGDCNDTNAAISPAATEVCDSSNTDEDCDGTSDDSDSSVSSSTRSNWYRDADSDGYGDATNSKTLCDQPSGYVSNSTDCLDSNASVHPGGSEVCDGSNLDEDCDGVSDDSDSSTSSSTKTVWYLDADSDSYGLSTSSKTLCDQPSGYVTNSSDCNDSNAAINPAATEVCDSSNVDEDCDSLSDDNDSSASSSTKSTWYKDSDSDGYGLSSSTKSACDKPSGYSSTSGDCNDTSASVNPGAQEICDSANTDEDCDGTSDDSDSSTSSSSKTTMYLDSDGDGYGVTSSTSSRCDEGSSYQTDSGDCNDTNTSIHPNATESCTETDYDCDGFVNDGTSCTGWAYVVLSTSLTAFNILSADIYGDGYPEVFLPENYSRDIRIFGNTAGAVSSSSVSTLKSSSSDKVWSGNVGDLNNDGKLDMIMACDSSPGLWWFKNGGSSLGSATKIASSTDGINNPRTVDSDDLSGDGVDDILIADYNASKTFLWVNGGTGTFSSTPTTVDSTIGNPFQAFIGNPNADSYNDFFVRANTSVSYFKASYSSGVMSFTKSTPATGFTITWALIADMDNDGVKDDLVVADSTNSRVLYYLFSSGSYGTAQVAVSGISGLASLAVADMNGDGRKDLIVVSSTANAVYYYKITGSAGATPTFGSAVTIRSSFTSPSAVTVADIDDDGDNDVAIMGNSEARAEWNVNPLYNSPVD